MAIRAVIFDVGGVLSHHHNLAALDPWLDRLNLPAEQILHTVFGNEVGGRASRGQAAVAEIWAFANQTFGLSEDDLRALKADVWATQTWDTDLLDYIRSLKATYKTGIISDAWPNAWITNVPITDELFDVIVYSAEEGLLKPDPEIFHRALSRLDVKPAEAIFVDDTQRKVDGAVRVGMHGLLFTDSQAIKQQITEVLDR